MAVGDKNTPVYLAADCMIPAMAWAGLGWLIQEAMLVTPSSCLSDLWASSGAVCLVNEEELSFGRGIQTLS